MCSQSLLYYLLAVLMGMEVLIDRHILLLVMLGSVRNAIFRFIRIRMSSGRGTEGADL